MAHYYHIAQDSSGNAVSGASVSVYTDVALTTLAAIYSNAALSVALANPFLSASDGVVQFYATSGEYHLKVTKAGYPDRTIPYVQVGIGVPETRTISTTAPLTGGGALTANRTLGITQSGIDHGSIGGLSDDDHSQYSRADGTRAFTAAVAGVTPTLAAHLATRGFVEGDRLDGNPAARVKRSSDLSVASATVTTVSWATEVHDSGSMWTAGSPSRVTITRAGLYLVVGSASWDVNAAGFRSVKVMWTPISTGVAVDAASQSKHRANGAPLADDDLSAQNVLLCSVGDYFEMTVLQNTGAALTLFNRETTSLSVVCLKRT